MEKAVIVGFVVFVTSLIYLGIYATPAIFHKASEGVSSIKESLNKPKSQDTLTTALVNLSVTEQYGSQCEVGSTILTITNLEKNTNPSQQYKLVINGNNIGSVPDGTTRTVSPGDKIKVYFLDESSQEFEIPCMSAVASAQFQKTPEVTPYCDVGSYDEATGQCMLKVTVS